MLDDKQCPACRSTDSEILADIPSESLIVGYSKSKLLDDVARLFSNSSTTISLCHCRHCDLRWFVNAPAGDASFYEALQSHDWYYQADKPEYAFAAAQVHPNASVLEVGCGRGAFDPASI